MMLQAGPESYSSCCKFVDVWRESFLVAIAPYTTPQSRLPRKKRLITGLDMLLKWKFRNVKSSIFPIWGAINLRGIFNWCLVFFLVRWWSWWRSVPRLGLRSSTSIRRTSGGWVTDGEMEARRQHEVRRRLRLGHIALSSRSWPRQTDTIQLFMFSMFYGNWFAAAGFDYRNVNKMSQLGRWSPGS